MRLPSVRDGFGLSGWRRRVRSTHADGLGAASTQNTPRCRIASSYIYMLSDHCDSAHRVAVGRADLFWASYVVIL
jgi:hypothetical protein